MILYSEQNVYEAAKDRIRKLFSMGDRLGVCFSGGKDSTALLHLTLEVTSELGIQKLPVIFLDQECEYTYTVEYMRYVMSLPEVEPIWVQIPFRLWNANSGDWFIPWEPGKVWMREKEDVSFKENVYGVDRFKDMFDAIAYHHLGGGYISLGGVRIEESPARRAGLTGKETLPGMTYGKRCSHGVVIYPLYDWSYRDIWYYIFSNRLKYNKVYNYIFSNEPLRSARVSSLIHENSNQNIPYLQEIDPKAYNAMYMRIPNIGTTNHLLLDVFEEVRNYPNCFKDWPEYLQYLIDNIVAESKNKVFFTNNLNTVVDKIAGWSDSDRVDIYRAFARGIITEDFEQAKLNNRLLVHKSKYKYGKTKRNNHPDA